MKQKQANPVRPLPSKRQLIEVVRVARPSTERKNQPGPPFDLGKVIEHNFMADAFAPDRLELSRNDNDTMKARTATFKRICGQQGYMTKADFEAKNFAPYGIDANYVFDYTAEDTISEQQAEIERLKAELEKAKEGGAK